MSQENKTLEGNSDQLVIFYEILFYLIILYLGLDQEGKRSD